MAGAALSSLSKKAALIQKLLTVADFATLSHETRNINLHVFSIRGISRSCQIYFSGLVVSELPEKDH
jgi:hypothetical protein